MIVKNKTAPAYLLFVLSLGFIMAVLDTTGVVLAIPKIEQFLTVSLNESIWIINAYILALGTLLLLCGNLTSRYGAKRILITGMVIFTLASFGCSVSVNIEMLIVLRFIQGFGASLFMPSSLALLFASYPDAHKRARMLGIWTAIISVATGTGSFIGGTMIGLWGWRSIFLVNIPLGIITIISILILVKNNDANKTVKIDFISNLLLVLSLGSLIIYLVEGNQYGYGNMTLMIFLVLAVIFAVVLFLREKTSQAPIVPHHLLKNAQFLTSNILGLAINISLYGIVLVFGLYFQTYLKLSPMVSGLLILPGMIVLIIGNLLYAKVVKRIKAGTLAKSSIILCIAGALGIVIFGVLFENIPLYLLIVLFALMTFGIGILTPATTTLLMEAAGQKFSGIAGATLNANKQIGGLFGTAIMGIVIASLTKNWEMVLVATFSINVVLYVMTWILASRFLKHSEII
ncbi:MAG: MFS transporter [Streptococcaceae bacterium]|jgi:DHA2 family methylenomycin A resistance protein-like MFS transporter|nr:MFS transporter [Streptococcaceae bacterium]